MPVYHRMDSKKVDKVIEYPVIMVSKSTGNLILFSDQWKGTYLTGEHAGRNSHTLNIHDFKEYEGTVTLSNNLITA